MLSTGLLFLRQQQITGTVIDRDGVTYLQAAAGFLEHGWAGAIALKQQATWPFYSILIALVAKFSGLSVPIAAQLLDFILVLASVTAFVHIVSLIEGSRSIRYYALFSVLSWHTFTKYFPDILRDHGFHCFLLLSAIMFYYYLQQFKWRYACAWWLCLALAFSFRLEAIVYFILLPLGVFCYHSKTKLSRCVGLIKLYFLPIVMVVGYMLYQPDLGVDDLRFAYVFSQITKVLTAIDGHWAHQVAQLKHTVFHQTHFVGLGLFAAVIVIFCSLLLECFGWLSVVSLIYVIWHRRTCLASKHWHFVNCYGVAAFLIMLLFFLEYFFLSGRYPVQLGLFVLTVVPFVLRDAYQQFAIERHWLSREGKILIGMSIIVLYNVIASSFHFGHYHTSVSIDAGHWIQRHLPVESTIITNSKRVSYYAATDERLRRADTWQRITSKQSMQYLLNNSSWHCYDYLVFVGDLAPFDQTYLLLRRRHLLAEKVKQFYDDPTYGAVIVKVDPQACVK